MVIFSTLAGNGAALQALRGAGAGSGETAAATARR